MNRAVGSFGKIILTCIVAGIAVVAFFQLGKEIYEKSPKEQEVIAGNMSKDMLLLASHNKHPFFVGSECITICRNYRGIDNREGFSKEDALSFIKAYEYVWEEGEERRKEIPREKIQVYPYDDPAAVPRVAVDVTTTGKYTVKYSVEGESGLKADRIMLVLVDVLPKGQEYLESGAENESSD